MQLLRLPAWLQGAPTFGSGSDFDTFVSADEFTTVATDSGSVTNGDAVGGIAAIIPSDASVADNDETYLKGTKEIFKWAVDKPMLFEARAQYAEANTNTANVIIGYKDAVAANTLVDDGGGPPSSYYGANFHKLDGGTKWLVETSMGATQLTNTTNVTAGGAAYQRFRIESKEEAGDIINTFFIDDVQCVDSTTLQPIKHRIAIASATEMQLCLGQKNGAITAVETLNVDYCYGFQKR